MKKLLIFPMILLITSSCTTHKRSHIVAEEQFVVELKKPASRGGLVGVALEGVLFGATYLAEKSSQSLLSSYKESISINDYYSSERDGIRKTYNEIQIKKYSKPKESADIDRIKEIITQDVASIDKTRGGKKTLMLKELIREEKDDLLNFNAVVEIITDPENAGITRLSFKELYVFFSKTKVYSDEDLNAKISISIEGQWRNSDNSPAKAILIEQEFDFKKLKYGLENQIKEPILTPWYYDIPILSEIENNSKYGVLKVTIQLDEYEGNKSKYVSKLPSMLSDNKSSIIQSGTSTIQKILN